MKRLKNHYSFNYNILKLIMSQVYITNILTKNKQQV